MFKIMKLALVALLIGLVPNVQAERTTESSASELSSQSVFKYNVGVFISTIPKQGWRQTKLVDEWKGDVFDDIIIIDEKTIQKFRDDGMAKVNDRNYLRNTVVRNFIDQLIPLLKQRKAKTSASLLDMHVSFIGHSVLGGYLARTLSSIPEAVGLDPLRINVSGFRLASADFSCITVGTPHQGIGVAAVDVRNRPGFVNVAPTLENFRQDLRAGLLEDQFEVAGLIALITLIVAVITYILIPNLMVTAAVISLVGGGLTAASGRLNSFIKEQKMDVVRDLDENLIAAKMFIGDKIESTTGRDVPDVVEIAFNTALKELLKPDMGDGQQGLLIRGLNSLPNPSYYRSVFSAEKSPIPVRLSSEIVSDIVIELTDDITLLDISNEKEFVDTYDGVKRYTRAQRNWWWRAHQWVYYTSRWKIGRARRRANAKKDRHKRRSRNWGRTNRALSNIDRTQGRIINANKYERRTGTRQIYDPTICPSGGGFGHLGFKLASKEAIEQNLIRPTGNCLPFRTQQYSYVSVVPLKNDGVSAPNYATWNKNESLTARGDNNFYYSDAGDGGYNHLEVRRARRLYTQGRNRKGDLAEPMRQTRDWLKAVVVN